MTAFRVAGFSGIMPRIAKRLLADNQAQIAVNCQLTSGDMQPFNEPLTVNIPGIAGEIQSIYRMNDDAGGKWLAWAKDVNAVPGPVAGDTSQRLYYTGDLQPRVTNYALATSVAPYPTSSYVLGVFPPSVAPTVSVTGGSGSTETRAYAYTFVTDWGEESAPSPAGSATGYINGTWNVNAMDVAPPNSGTISNAVKDTPAAGQVEVTLDSVFGMRAGESLTFASVTGMTDLNATFALVSVDKATNKVVVSLATTQTYTAGADTWARVVPHNTGSMTKRIYRTVSGSSSTEYQLAKADLAVATVNYADTLAAAALGEILPSTTWEMPPVDMTCLIALPNGMMAAISGNELCFCEPWHPHAWPIQYRLSANYAMVAIGVFGNTIVVGTAGTPYVVTGTSPDGMSMQAISENWPCLAKRGMVSLRGAVEYPCPQGLAHVGSDGSYIVTTNIYTEKYWGSMNPASFVSASHNNRYYSGYIKSGVPGMLIFDRNDGGPLVETNKQITAAWQDPRSGKLYFVIDSQIVEWNADEGLRAFYDWMSKEFLFLPPVNFAACKVDADFSMTEAEIAAAQAAYDAAAASNLAIITAKTTNGSLNSSALNTYPVNGDALALLPALSFDSLTFSIYVNGVLKFSKQLKSAKAFKLPGGYKVDNAAVRVSGNVRVLGVVLGESMVDLKGA